MLSLRRAEPSDVPTLLELVRELAIYEREPDAVVATEDDFRRDGFTPGERPLFEAQIAEWEGKSAGFALYFFQWSTWRGRPTLYLEDLFVRESMRGRGIGKALMVRLAAEAVKRRCERFQWAVLDWNAPSIAFYESLGAVIQREWLTVRLDGKALETLAKSG